MHRCFELAILVLAQSGAPRFVDVTAEHRASPAGAFRERTDRRLVAAHACESGRLADARPFPLFDGVDSPRHTLASADVDGDGKADLVVANSFGRARLFLNDGPNDGLKDGSPHFTEVPLLDGREVVCATRFVAFTDLDGDGKPELFIAAPADPVGEAALAAKPAWLDGLARRVQRDAASFVAGGVVVACSKEGRRDVTAQLGLEKLPPFRCGTVADLDGDGAPELVLFGGASDDMQSFWERVVPTFARVGADPVAAANAMASLAAPPPPYPIPRVLARGADSRFALVAAEFPADLATFDVTSVETKDFDGDGAPDLVLHGGSDDEPRWLRNVTRVSGATTTTNPADAPKSASDAPDATSAFVVKVGVPTPAPGIELAATSGTHLRLDAKHARPCLVVRLDAVADATLAAALTAEARALDGADVVLVDAAGSDETTARARTVLALIATLVAGDHAAAPLLRIDGDGFVDVVAGGVTLTQLRDVAHADSPQLADDDLGGRRHRALVALPRGEREARLPNVALAALTKLESAGENGLDVEFGLALADTRKFPDAMARLAKAPPTAPDLGAAYLDVGRRLVKLNRSPEARAAFEKSIEVAPADPAPRYELGRLLLMSKEKEHADLGTESLRVATYLAPDFADAQYAFGQGLARVGRRDEAVMALERALALDPDAVQAKAARDLLESLRTRKKQ